MKASVLVAALLLLSSAAVAQEAPDMEVVKQQIDLDARAMGELHSQVNLLVAALTKAKADLTKAQSEIAGWKEYARPLYDQKPQ